MFFNIFRKHLNLVYFICFLLLITGCQLREPSQIHGISFIKNREKQLIINQTNKNDVINILGKPHIESLDENSDWIYVERVTSKGKIYKLGKSELKKNDILVLKFDDYGILKEKKIYDKDNMNKISFIDKSTENDISKESFVTGLLQSLREKMYGNRKF